MSISGVGGSMGSYNYTYGIQSSPQKTDFRKIFEEEKAEFYEKYKNGETKPSYQIGGSSFTEEDWDKLIEGVDELTEEMREIMREQHKKRYERLLEKRREGYVDDVYTTYTISKMSKTVEKEVKVSDFREFETKNYKFVPEPTIGEGGMRIIKNGQSVAVFSVNNLKVRVDEQTGTRVLISEIGGYGGAWYDAIPVDAELESGLAEAMGVEEIEEVALEGYYIGTHTGTGIQYVMRPGDEGRGGKVLLKNESDVAKYNALAEEYYERYPNLVTSKEFGGIYATFEICGMMERTATGIVKIGYDNISYNDNFNYEKNWSIMLDESTWELLNEWLKENKEHMKELYEIGTWKAVFDKIGGSYERIMPDEELIQ